MLLYVVLLVACFGLSNRAVIDVCVIGGLIVLFVVIILLFVVLIITGVWVQHFGQLLLNGFLVFGLCLHTFASGHCLCFVCVLLFDFACWTCVVSR